MEGRIRIKWDQSRKSCWEKFNKQRLQRDRGWVAKEETRPAGQPGYFVGCDSNTGRGNNTGRGCLEFCLLKAHTPAPFLSKDSGHFT